MKCLICNKEGKEDTTEGKTARIAQDGEIKFQAWVCSDHPDKVAIDIVTTHAQAYMNNEGNK